MRILAGHLKLFVICLFLACLSSTALAATVDLRQTGQTTSYAAGDDGDVLAGAGWPSPRFSDNGNGTVTDNLTGLIWLKDANCAEPVAEVVKGSGVTWANALVWSNNLANGNCGLQDGSTAGQWRLPTVNELQSMINVREPKSAQWLSAQGFANLPASALYWSSTTSARDIGNAWILNMYGGSSDDAHSKTEKRYVWPVRAGQSGVADPSYPANLWNTGQTTTYSSGDDGSLRPGVAWPSPRFTDNGNGTVTDNLTGLTWLKDANCIGAQTWNGALKWSNNLADGNCGLADGPAAGEWRLPNREELHSLTDFSRSKPALPVGHPFTSVQSVYWSSTTYATSHIDAWGVDMADGSVGTTDKTVAYYVWPVSGGGLFGNSAISVSPLSMDFGTISLGSPSPPQTFTISNTGSNNLYISTITKTGANADDFDMQNDNCSDQTIAPTEACTVDVVFSPETVGSKSAGLYIPSNAPSGTTKAGLSGFGVDTTPDPFAFTDQTGAALSAAITSEPINVSGIDAPAPISISVCSTLCEYSINSGIFTSVSETVNNGDTVKVRQTSSGSYLTTTHATLAIGGASDTFSVETMAEPIDTTPDPFTFIDQTGVALNTAITSNLITVSGINAPATISITGGEYSINGGAFISAEGPVNNGDSVRVRQTSSGSYSTTTNAALTIGGVSDIFGITTINVPVYTISAFAPGGHGSILCTPATVNSGGSSVCAIAPETGYHVANVQVGPTGGTLNSVGAVAAYTISGITSDMSISAAFAINTSPAITIGTPSITITNAGPVTYAIAYAKAIGITLSAGNVTLNTTGDATGRVAVSGAGTTSRTVTVSGITGNGTIGISIAAGTASDSSGAVAPPAGPSATFTVRNYFISGKVTATGPSAASSGFTITLSGTVGGRPVSGTATTLSDGSYTITGLANGIYTLTATKIGYDVTSTNPLSVTVSGSNVSGADFAALTKSISGKVTATGPSAASSGFTITLSGTVGGRPVSGTATTLSDGSYTINVLANGTIYAYCDEDRL